MQNTLISGVVENYGFVYEISIKMLKRVIERESASPTEVYESNFKNLPQTAGEKGPIADVEAWFKSRKMRNITAHTYDQQKTHQVCQNSLGFIIDAWVLLGALERRNV